MPKRSPERAAFWSDVLITAIENGGYGHWFTVDEYQPYLPPEYTRGEKGWAATPEAAFAVITVTDDGVEECGRTYRIDLDALAEGYGKMDYSDRLSAAYREYDAGNIDAFDALNMLECFVFGEVVYG